jgi:hypothetical protein
MTNSHNIPEVEISTLGGGCFWCLDPVYADLQGVAGVTVGYAGGTVSKPLLLRGVHRRHRARRSGTGKIRPAGDQLQGNPASLLFRCMTPPPSIARGRMLAPNTVR